MIATSSPETAHPVGEDMLWDYHRGALSSGQALILNLHLKACPACRETMSLFSAIGTSMLVNAPDVPLEPHALDQALARIERPVAPGDTLQSPPVSEAKDVTSGLDLPAFSRSALSGLRYGKFYWAAPGVWMLPIRIGGEPKRAKTYLMHVKAGMTMPPHAHRGRELTLVLKGRYDDGLKTYSVGDVAQCNDDEVHAPSIPADEDCLCLISQEGPIRPRTWLGRALQPFARI